MVSPLKTQSFRYLNFSLVLMVGRKKIAEKNPQIGILLILPDTKESKKLFGASKMGVGTDQTIYYL